MESSAFHKLSRVLWTLGVGIVVMLAIYVSVGRSAMGVVSAYQDEILAELNARLPFRVEARSVSGEWHMFTPELVLAELRLTFPGSPESPLELGEGRLSLDTLSTLYTRSLQSSVLRLADLTLHVAVDASGAWHVAGFASDGSGKFNEWLEAFVGNVTQIELVANNLIVALPDNSERVFELDLLLRREGSRRQLGATLQSSEGAKVDVLVDGVGNPFDSSDYSGDIYIRTEIRELASFIDLVPVSVQSDLSVSGQASVEAWMELGDGMSAIEVQVDARSLDIRAPDSSWRVPVQTLAFDGSFVEQRNLWTVFASRVEVSDGETALSIPRVQVDGWGDSLRVRAQELDLAKVNRLLIDSDSMPEGLSKVLATLSPRGQLATVEYSLEDLSQVMTAWQLAANFEDIAVESWNGAPGVTSASGFVALSPGSGEVILDSRLFDMTFPTVYDNPLRYDELYGTIGIDWDKERLTLSSGKITARGVEGTANALFGLLVPFGKVDTGVEMELLVGLADSNPIHRSKYLPRSLDASLLDWLKSSIGEGRIREGAFLWRGSLAQPAAAHRTVQLYFDVVDTRVTYHPQWPALTGLEGLILIDDAQVSFWSERARLYDSVVQRLSAETWLGPSGRMKLAIDGSLTGDALDGLRVVNNSPLTDIVGSAFEAWSLEGDLETRLRLSLDLGQEPAPPGIEVDLILADANLMARPGELPVSQISGAVRYSSLEGFSSQDLSGQLWGETVAARLRQRDVEESGARYGGSTSPVEILLEGDVAPASVQDWLGLDALAFMTGKTPISGSILVTPGEPVALNLASTLEGVALDLPEPWLKSSDEDWSMELDVPLSGGSAVIDVRADPIYLQADVTGGSLHAASVAVAVEPLPLQAGGLRVTGEASLVDVEGWTRYIQTYFLSPGETSTPTPREARTAKEAELTDAGAESKVGLSPLADIEPAPMGEGEAGFWFSVEDLHADELRLGSQSVSNVVASLEQGSAGWLVTATADWFDGELRLQSDLQRADLLIRFLELSGLDTLELGENTLQSSLDLPTMDVTIEQLLNKGEPVGDAVFTLGTQGDLLSVGPIVGQLAGMQMSVDRPSILSWRQGGAIEETHFSGVLQLDNMGDSLEQLGYPRLLETKSGSLALDLTWPGGPQAYALEALQGSVRLEAGRGSFVDPPEGTSGTLRVVSFLNLAGIVNRLSLTHMFEAGIPFDSLESEAFFRSGTAEVPAMIVQGAASGFQFSGVTDLVASTVEGELVVTLPVANNLPWVAALAAGLPVAAGVFVVSKVFQKQVNRFSSGVYKVSGSLDKPDVSFDRIFDNTQIDTISRSAPDANQPSNLNSSDKPAPESAGDNAVLPSQERATGLSLPATEVDGVARKVEVIDDPNEPAGKDPGTQEMNPVTQSDSASSRSRR